VAISVPTIKTGTEASDSEMVFLGWAGTIFFGFALLFLLFQLFFSPREPLILSPQGFLDKRKLKQEVLWSDISYMSVWSYKGNSSLRIQLKDATVQNQKSNLHARFIDRISRPFSLGGLYVNTLDLDISTSELHELFKKYRAEHNASVAQEETELRG